MASNFRTIDDLPLMSKADIAARLRSHVLPGHNGTRPDVMLRDIAKWCGCDTSLLRHIISGRVPCTDRRQVRLTQFFSMLDSRRVELVVNGKNRTFEPIDPRRPIPIPPIKAHIDFTASGPKVRFA